MSKYKLGMVVGRFQPLTEGHKLMIDKALSFCKHGRSLSHYVPN